MDWHTGVNIQFSRETTNKNKQFKGTKSLNGNVVNWKDHLEGHYANNPFNLDLCCKGTRQLPQ